MIFHAKEESPAMSDCCSRPDNNRAPSKKHRCPVSGRDCSEVSARTVAHHIKSPWQVELTGRRYFFCDDPACDVVYFGGDNATILKSQLRTPIGIKEESEETLLCYCFGVSKAEAQRDTTAKAFVLAQTKARQCSCETRHPAGRCCLKDFPNGDQIDSIPLAEPE